MSIREMLIKFLANRLGHGASATGGAMREQTTREWATRTEQEGPSRQRVHRAGRSEQEGPISLLAKRPHVTVCSVFYFEFCSFAQCSANCACCLTCTAWRVQRRSSLDELPQPASHWGNQQFEH
jgi:hypothetical protein